MTKLNWIELRKAVAAQAGSSERETTAFMNALIAQIQLGLKTDRQVRITGLGTFRLQEVAPRKSVDVTTGQPIVLPGYNKIVFVPEAGIKELIQNGAPASATEENSPIQRLGQQADEIVAIIQQDINTGGAEPAQANTGESPETKTKEPTVADTGKPVEAEQTSNSNKYHFMRDLLITLSIIVLILLGCFFGLRTTIRHWIDTKLHSVEQVVSPVGTVATSTIDSTENAEFVEEQEQSDAVATPQEKETVEPQTPAKPAPVVKKSPKRRSALVYKEFIADEPVTRNATLAQMARKYYDGKTDLWVFIYDANYNHIRNPHNIKEEDVIRIPKLSDELLDLDNPQTQQIIEELRKKYE